MTTRNPAWAYKAPRRSRLAPRMIVAMVLVAVVEVVGRLAARTDVHDLLAVPVVWAAVIAAGPSVWRPPLRLFKRLDRASEEMWTCEYGVDFRETPPIPRALPTVYAAPPLIGLAFIALLVGLTPFVSPETRPLAPVSYALHVLGLSLVWALLLIAALAAAFVGSALVHNAFVARHVGPGPRSVRAEVLVLAAMAIVSVGSAIALPGWAALLVIVAGGLVRALWLAWPGGPKLDFLWKRKREGSPVRSFSIQFFMAYESTIDTVMFLCVMFLGGAGAWLGLPTAADAAPFTAGLLKLSAWTCAVFLNAFSLLWVLDLRSWWRATPSRPCPLCLRIDTADGVRDEDRAAVESIARERGWRVAGPEPEPGELAVGIRLVPSPMPPLGADPLWPLAVSARAFGVTELQDLIEQRDMIQRRRAVRRVLGRLFRLAARRKYEKGSGFLVAPHFWWVEGLERDEDEGDFDRDGGAVFETIGPHYDKIMPKAARAHLYEVLRDVEIDLIFVEDGVGFRRLLRVLDAVFEHYDGPGGRIEEYNLGSITDVHTMIHEHELDNPFERKGYPEPEYEELARARILEVFKDREDEEERDDLPVSIDALILNR